MADDFSGHKDELLRLTSAQLTGFYEVYRNDDLEVGGVRDITSRRGALVRFVYEFEDLVLAGGPARSCRTSELSTQERESKSSSTYIHHSDVKTRPA